MKCKYLIVNSVTYAMKAKAVLKSRGIDCKVEKVKNVPVLNGCGYGLKINEGVVGIASRYVGLSGIKIVDIIDCEAKSR